MPRHGAVLGLVTGSLTRIGCCKLDRAGPVALVGDAPQDIQAAQANRICSIAVATGISTREELAARAPDYLRATLRELRLDMVGIG